MYAVSYDYVGSQPIINFAPDTVQRHPLGALVPAVDPIMGGGEFIYLKSNAVILAGSLVIWDLLNVATLCTSTAIMGKSVAIAMMPAAAGTFFWAAVRGDNIPAVATATVVADATVGIGTASGTMTGTIVAGKAINNAKGTVASAGTRTFANAQTVNGSPIITVQDAGGLYIGAALSGTGVGAGTVTAIAPDNRTVTNSANSTATGSVTLTATNTGFIIVQIDRPFAQGPIT